MRTGGAELARECEDIGERGAVSDGAMAGALDDRTVGERIAEGDAEFEDVHTGIDRGECDGERGGNVGIADGEVDDEAGFLREANRHLDHGLWAPGAKARTAEVKFPGEDAHVLAAAAGDVDDEDVFGQ